MSNNKRPQVGKHPTRPPSREELSTLFNVTDDLPRLLAKLSFEDVASSVWMSDDALLGLEVALETALHRTRALRAKTRSRS